jgi:cyclopropane-fatty-acyl-phospholipid synthase
MTFNLTQRGSRHTHDMRLGKQTKNIWAYFLARLLNHIQVGSLSVIMPDGARIESHTIHTDQHATIIIHDLAALRKLILGGSIGFSESYIAGHWTSPELPRLIEILALNGETLSARLRGSAPARITNYILHRLKRNSRRGSKSNIRYHYDLGNDFYQKWLGSAMIYSSAIFADDDDDLDRAQTRKMNRIIDLLDISEDQSVLEIGCGWGALSRYIAENKKSRVHGITLSKQQLSYAQNMIQESEDKALISLELTDYRDVVDSFDRIVSIEMIEAVGEEFLPKYFETIRNRLTPGGRAVIQAITIDEQKFDRYKATPDFIQKYIFPGGFLTTKTMMHRYAAAAGLNLCHAEYFGKSYARTLKEWRSQFITQWSDITRLGYDDKFRNMWDFYLAYCEGGFNAGSIDVGLYVLKKSFE